MRTIYFKKTFLSGTLQGLTVSQSYSVPNVQKIIDNHLNSLQQTTKKHPKMEIITNSKYFVTDVSIG